MGANKVTNFQKCGDIFINTKTMKNKTKAYIFQCGFCSADCDQLKKFSKHLEDEHLLVFEEDKSEDIAEPSQDLVLLFEPDEIKVEVDDVENVNKTILNTSKSLGDFIDPLCTVKTEVIAVSNNFEPEDDGSTSTIINSENDFEANEGDISLDHVSDEEIEVDKKMIEEEYTVEESTSKEYSDDTKDADFDIEVEANKTKKLRNKSKKEKLNSQPRKKQSRKETNESTKDNKIIKRRRPIYENLLPLLIQKYKQYEILWQVDNIAFGVINKKYEVYGKIADEIKSDQNLNLDDVKYHINYLNQLYSKDKEQEIKCNLEKKNFVPEYELYTEMSFLNRSQGPFLCANCKEILPRYELYCLHMAQHTDNPAFKCPSCSFTCNKYLKFVIHKKRHLGVLNYHCDVCGKGYLFKNDLEWHVTSHTGDKPFLCQICGRGFRARHGYDNHIRRHEQRFRYECHVCKRGYNFLTALNTHMKSHLNIRDKVCKICGKGFTDTQNLKRHELVHGDEKRYKCNTCGKAYYQAHGLRVHRKNHLH